MSRPRPGVLMGCFLAAALGAALAPFAGRSSGAAPVTTDGFPGWPTHHEGRALVASPLTPVEQVFARDFPGRIGRFRDGRREIIVRWVNAPTRRLHSAADCFRGSGYGVAALAVRKDAAGRAMGCFRARLGPDSMTVCEVIYDASGQSWPDVSAWYWHALFAPSPSSWWSYVVAERS